ncbi:nucleotidyltransferase domain-containing protein [Desemzia sp. RIT804]|uniref:nucleotidyltransferase domain-containing protein n=1 Tax=Desemzia sp. RIT 804 TaxID=2810209 RepID=UPI0019524451|nr:nucleotidyltransferase domain-containing protein [Desemzia sp. RIT 804]MBM6614966.1 nucleotidyltransferase domain-containing protein [Desemzia sp. RIT 804]
MRNNNLIEERARLLNRVKDFCIHNKKIHAFFLGGSLAVNNADEFSDIDFRVVIPDDASKVILLNELLEYFESQTVFIETKGSFYSVVHFSTFIKLDFFVYHPEKLKASVWFKDILILQDSKNLLASLKEDSMEKAFVVNKEELNNYLNKYTAYLHELYRRWNRKEYNYCEHCTLMMKHILVSLWQIEKGNIPNDLGDWSKYEGFRSLLNDSQKDLLTRFTPVNFDDITYFVECMNEKVPQSVLNISNHLNLQMNTEKYSSLFVHNDFGENS